MTSSETLLQLQGICKTFGATRALHQVNLSIRRGEVHALIGENGAGKSTLMKVLSGAYQADAGQILLNGKPCVIGNPADGRNLGIAMIYQELNLAPALTVEENLTLGTEKSTAGFVRNQREAIRKALELMEHPHLPLNAPVRSLSISLQQIVEIARALVTNASVVIMDEPTSSLTAADTRALFRVINRLKENGIAVIYISHFLEEVQEISDAYTVLRDGETVGSGRMADVTIPEIIEMMVGRKLHEMFPKTDHAIGETLLHVDNLKGRHMPHGVSFDLRRGEILGIAGLVGSGRSETIRSIFGLERAKDGMLTLSGSQKITAAAMFPRRAMEKSVDLLSEDRKEEGLAVSMSIRANTTLSSLTRFASLGGWGLINLRKEGEGVQRWIKDLGIKCQGAWQPVVGLSGGNQQKVAMARILERKCEIVLLDEPTRGVDVGSKIDIYRMVGQLAAQGKAVVFVSSYLPELFGVCDTIAVMHRGHISAVKPVKDWTEHDVMLYATSGN